MQTTMNLLEAALSQRNASEWASHLKLASNALRMARMRGHLSPAIAGALAEALGENPKDWIVIAALESERDSACKTRMIQHVGSKVVTLMQEIYQALAAAATGARPSLAQRYARSLVG